MPSEAQIKDSPIDEAGRAGLPAKRSWLASRVTLAVLAVALLGTSIPLALARQADAPPAASPQPSPAPTVTPPRVPFAFASASVQTEATGARRKAVAKRVATEIQDSLGAFYDQAFLDPLTWEAGAPPQVAWDSFAPPLRNQATEDVDSLALGSAAAELTALDVTRSTLSVEVLLDPGGRPQAALAIVAFRALGTLTSGEGIRVTNRATFLVRPSSGEWLIVGYPNASTIVKAIGANP